MLNIRLNCTCDTSLVRKQVSPQQSNPHTVNDTLELPNRYKQMKDWLVTSGRPVKSVHRPEITDRSEFSGRFFVKGGACLLEFNLVSNVKFVTWFSIGGDSERTSPCFGLFIPVCARFKMGFFDV